MRRKKRGPKTKKGRNRFHTDWKEPKLLILYVVGDDGRPSQTWAPIIDGTLRGPEAVFALLLSYARQIGLNAADKVLFIADGAPWIWRRLQRLIAALGLSPTQVLGLIDFYHAAKQLSDAVKLRPGTSTRPDTPSAPAPSETPSCPAQSLIRVDIFWILGVCAVETGQTSRQDIFRLGGNRSRRRRFSG